jgi:hypothetical protein
MTEALLLDGLPHDGKMMRRVEEAERKAGVCSKNEAINALRNGATLDTRAPQ